MIQRLTCQLIHYLPSNRKTNLQKWNDPNPRYLVTHLACHHLHQKKNLLVRSKYRMLFTLCINYLCFLNSDESGHVEESIKVLKAKTEPEPEKQKSTIEINIPSTSEKLLQEQMLVKSLLQCRTKEKQLEVMKKAKREHLKTVVIMAKKCYADRGILKKYSEKDQNYLKKNKSSVISALDSIRTSNLKKDKMISILSGISKIDNGKILKKLLESYVDKVVVAN